MNPMIRLLAGLLMLAGLNAWAAAGTPGAGSWPDCCNVAWDSPSADSFGSMPLGNGDVGLNVWVEPNGDLLFYISKVDAFDARHMLPKLGRVRLRFTPALVAKDFRQTLVLREGAISIHAGSVDLRVWVDANHPVVRVTGSGQTPLEVVASFETLRLCSEQLDAADRLAWGYRNTTSAWMERVRAQNTPEFAARVHDPILNRTSGCRMSGVGFVRAGARSLKLAGSRRLDLAIRVLSSQPATLAEWFAQLETPVPSDWAAHLMWWQAFWDRSQIRVSGCGEGAVNLDPCRFTQFPQGVLAYAGHKEIASAANAFQLTQRYALERFCEAAAGRGVVPPPYNGSIFTMDMPAGVMGFDKVKPNPVSPDGRDWASLSFMWQNTRHPYWAMATRGDTDTMLPGMQFVRDGLELCRDRCRRIFDHEGAYIMEASWWGNVGVFDPSRLPAHLRYHFLATIETPAMMCEYYEHTRDKKFLEEILLPCADEFIRFYEVHFPKRDSRGKMVMAPAAVVETYQPVTNPVTELSGLRFVLTKLLSFEIGQERRAHWTKLLGTLPELPTRRIKGLDLLAVGDTYAPGREICESPELYAVYPFRQAWLGRPERLAMARQSFHVRTTSLDGTVDSQAVETGGWQASPVQAACLGLGREAARLASINFNDQFIHWNDNIDPQAPFPSRPRPRFPAFWETKMDGTPDNDHGANSVNTLQSMLLQSDGEKIYLLPAWPEDWDVSFKLHANAGATVECVYRGGKFESLKVTPASRTRDVVNMVSLENRVRTLVRVACADRNYLFGLPPMLDGQATAQDERRLATTGPWLARYGESVYGTRSGPFAPGAWGGSLFNGNLVYLHVLEWPAGGVKLPAIARKLISAKCLTGGAANVVQSETGTIVTPDKRHAIDTIFRLEFDGPLETIALAAPYLGSLTTGRKVAASSAQEGRGAAGAVDADAKTSWAPGQAGAALLEVDLSAPRTFERAEIEIENPGHRRGQSNPFEIQALQSDGSWTTVYRGALYGSICGKKFDPVTARHVRLKITAPGVRQFDLFAVSK